MLKSGEIEDTGAKITKVVPSKGNKVLKQGKKLKYSKERKEPVGSGVDTRGCVTKTPPKKQYPQWKGSEAQRLLKIDMDEGKHLQKKPRLFQKDRPEYQEFPGQVFRNHIYQELRSRKYYEKKGKIQETQATE